MTIQHRKVYKLLSMSSQFKFLFCARSLHENSSSSMKILNENSPHHSSSMLKVLSNGAYGISKAVLLQSPSGKVLFNCGESVDRNFKGDINAIFITHLDWSNTGGIPSLCHKFVNRQKVEIPFHAPPGLDVFVQGAEKFVPTQDFKVNIVDFDPSSNISYDQLKVFCIPLKSRSQKQNNFQVPFDQSWILKTRRKFVRTSSILKKPVKGCVELDTSYSYVCKYESPRTWMLSECVRKGITPGPDMRKLWEGHDVVLHDGTIVRPSDVIKAGTSSVIVVVDCPSEGYLDDLLEENKYEEHCITKDILSPVVVHFTPSSVMKDERYITWMEKFPKNTIHMIVNDSNEWNGSVKVINRQEVCKLISPRFFPTLCTSVNLTYPENSLEAARDGDEAEPCSSDQIIREETSESWRRKWSHLPEWMHIVGSRCGTIINLRNQDVIREAESFLFSNMRWLLNNASVCKDISNMPNANESQSTSLKEPAVTFLGTCSQGSSLYRNSSGILVHMSPDKSMLLDCGDGLSHQIALLYNESTMQKVLRTLKCIYVSHPHADHHAGIISVLLAVRKANRASGEQPHEIVVLAPAPLIDWLETYHNKFEPILENCIVIILSDMLGCGSNDRMRLNNLFKKVLDLKQVQVCKAIHCPFSYCLSFEHVDGWKISYSGDSMVSSSFIKIGEGSDLLIHEATYATKLQSMAIAHAHSTIGDAIQVGRRMKAKSVILTHFSKRYPVIPYLYDLQNTSNVSVAFDFLKVSLSDLHLLPKLNESYKIVFESYEKENEELSQRLESKLFDPVQDKKSRTKENWNYEDYM